MVFSLFFPVLLGVALGFFEASVVVYLRALVYPGAPLLPMKDIPSDVLAVEALREAASIVLIWAAAALSGKTRALKVANFLLIFGVWDICYYVFLRTFLHWPASPSDWDILFLIPAPWLAPVWAPVLCSATFIFFAAGMHRLWKKGYPLPITRADILAAAAASLPILQSFFWETGAALRGTAPCCYPWPLLLLGLAMAWAWALVRFNKCTRFY